MIKNFWNAYSNFCIAQAELINIWETTLKNKFVKETATGKIYKINKCIPTDDFLCTFIFELKEINPSLKSKTLSFLFNNTKRIVLEDLIKLENNGELLEIEI